MGKDDYTAVRLPESVIKKIDDYIKDNPEYVSRPDFVKQVIRQYIDERREKE